MLSEHEFVDLKRPPESISVEMSCGSGVAGGVITRLVILCSIGCPSTKEGKSCCRIGSVWRVLMVEALPIEEAIDIICALSIFAISLWCFFLNFISSLSLLNILPPNISVMVLVKSLNWHRGSTVRGKDKVKQDTSFSKRYFFLPKTIFFLLESNFVFGTRDVHGVSKISCDVGIMHGLGAILEAIYQFWIAASVSAYTMQGVSSAGWMPESTWPFYSKKELLSAPSERWESCVGD